MRTTKVTPKHLCEAYNTCRQELVGKKLIGENVYNALIKKNIPKWIVSKMLQMPTLFTKVQREGRGKCIGYMFSYNPVNIAWFENWLPKQSTRTAKKENLTFEEECVQYLQKQGYTLKRCKGFDESRFSKDYPDLYKEYLIYESV